MTDSEIRRVLLQDWDPCQIGSNANLADEYDEFIPRIRVAVEMAAHASEVGAVLFDMETYMHAPIFEDDRKNAAQILFALIPR